MDTNIYRYILAIAECGSISAASRKLFVSQPALTKHLKKLEEDLGIRLFDRGRVAAEPTSAGRIFLEYAAEYLALEGRMMDALRQHTSSSKLPLKIATTHRGGDYVGSHTKYLLAQHPNLIPEYLNVSAELCESMLEQEQVEVAIYTDPVLSPKLEYMPLEEDVLVWVIPKGHRILDGIDLTDNSPYHPVQIPVERFRDPEQSYVLATPGRSLYHAENSFFKKNRISPQKLSAGGLCGYPL